MTSMIDSQRQWVGEDSPGYHLAWAFDLSSCASKLVFECAGISVAKQRCPTLSAARSQSCTFLAGLMTLMRSVLIRDLDDQHELERRLEQARTADKSGTKIVIGVAGCERECWVICGFDPENDNEKQILDLERQKLGANPCDRSHELTAC